MRDDHLVKVLIHDTRIKGGTPHADFTACLRLDKRDPLGLILDWVWTTGDRFGYIDELHIWAHGIESRGKGGLGVQFGADGINLDNVYRWAGVAGWIDWIKLLACKAADTSGGDGTTLCSQFAAYSQAWLTASMDRQLYDTGFVKGGDINMGRWEGLVRSWDPNGVETRPYY